MRVRGWQRGHREWWGPRDCGDWEHIPCMLGVATLNFQNTRWAQEKTCLSAKGCGWQWTVSYWKQQFCILSTSTMGNSPIEIIKHSHRRHAQLFPSGTSCVQSSPTGLPLVIYLSLLPFSVKNVSSKLLVLASFLSLRPNIFKKLL